MIRVMHNLPSAAADQMVVGVRHTELARIDVATDSSDEGHGMAPFAHLFICT